MTARSSARSRVSLAARTPLDLFGNATASADPLGVAIVSMAASDFVAAVRQLTTFLDELERDGFRLPHPVIPTVFITLPGVNAEGRALIVRKRKRDGAIVWDYHRRTRRLAGETGPHRRAFIAAIKRRPHAAPDAVRAARKAFAKAMKAARARDVMMARVRP
jgi:hypothetical protein